MTDNLVLEVTTDKAQYRLGEAITVRLYLFNFTRAPVLINSRLAVNAPQQPGEVSFEVHGPAGAALSFRVLVDIGGPRAEHFSVVVPQNCVGGQYSNLQRYYRIDESGQYRLTATYRNESPGKRAKMEVWKGVLTSNTAEFTVV